jgi:hypothetical protein
LSAGPDSWLWRPIPGPSSRWPAGEPQVLADGLGNAMPILVAELLAQATS